MPTTTNGRRDRDGVGTCPDGEWPHGLGTAGPGRKALSQRDLAVAIYLATHRPASVPPLTHAVWGGQAVGRKTVYNRIGQVRAILGHFKDGDQVLPRMDRSTGTNTLLLSPRVVTDLDLLRQALDDAHHSPSSQAVPRLREALALIEGEPFSGPGWEWAHEEQLTIEAAGTIGEAALHLVDLAMESGEPDVAREAITQGLRGIPGNEPLYRARMKLEHGIGNGAGIKAAWSDLSMFLADLEAEPSKETTALYRRLLGSLQS